LTALVSPRADPLRGARDRWREPLIEGPIAVIIEPITALSFGLWGDAEALPPKASPRAELAAPDPTSITGLSAELLICEAIAVVIEPITAQLLGLIVREAAELCGAPAGAARAALTSARADPALIREQRRELL
jgi:hypothetical protein